MNIKRAILLLAVLTVSITAVQAQTSNYNLELLGEPHSYNYVSPNDPSYQLVNLTYNGEPTSPDNLAADGGMFTWEYPSGSGINDSMEYLAEGIWYANINANTTTESINFTLENETSDSQIIWEEKKDTLDSSTLKIDKVTTLNDPIKAGKPVTFRVDVTNTTSGNQVTDANVQIRFVNGTYATEVVNIGYNDQNNIYRTSLDIPNYTNQTFVGQITANKGTEDSSYSFDVNTKPAIEGYIDEVSAEEGGCSASQMPDECEGNASLDLGFNVTQVLAESVNVTLLKYRNSGEEVVHDEISLTRNSSIPSDESGYYYGGFDFPFINRSEYQNSVKLKFNASSDNRDYIENHTIDYRAFRANIDFEKSYAYQSGEISIPLTLERYFSLNRIPEDQLKTLDVNITDPNENLFASYNLSNVSLGTDEQYTETVDIPGDAPVGDYSVELFVEDIYGGNATLMREFSVRENTQTFELGSNSLEPTFENTGQFQTTLNITDISGTGLNMSTEVSSGLENVLELPSEFQMDPDEQRELTLEWNITEVTSYSGEVEFFDEDSNYNTTISVDTNAPDCKFQNGNLCSLSNQNIEYSMNERTTEQTTIEILNIGNEGSQRQVSLSISGNISEYAAVQNDYNFDGSQTIPINFTPQEQGVYTGNLEIGDTVGSTLEYDLVLDSNVPSGAANADITESVSLGSLVEGESAEAEIEIENTGETTIENITVNSSTYSIEADTEGLAISPGSASTVQVSFNNVESDSGQLEVHLEALEDATETVSVSADVYSDYATRIDNLFTDIRNLRDSTSSQQALSTLNDAESQLDSAEISWENGNYQEAVNSYEEADELYSTAQTTVESQEPADGTEDPNTGTEDPGSQQPQNEGGGLPIIPIIVVIVLLIGGGFVFYESYIPEEGDPLYDVLGQ